MLVLARKTAESIVIDDTIRVTIAAIKGDRVRLGIEAPRGGAGGPGRGPRPPGAVRGRPVRPGLCRL